MLRQRTYQIQTIFLVVLTSVLFGCGGGSSGDGGAGNSASIPSAPSITAVVEANHAVTLSWSLVSGATSYNVYLASEPGVSPSTWSLLSNGSAHLGISSPATVSGLGNETQFFFVVTAKSSAGESSPSSQVSAIPHTLTPASLPTPRQGLAGTVLDGKLYAIGGHNGSYLDLVEVYDIASDSWVTAAPIIRRTELRAESLAGYVYAIAGRTISNAGSVANVNWVERFDPVSGLWATAANLPDNVYRFSSAILGGKILVTPRVHTYDPLSNVWSTQGVVQHGQDHASVAWNGRLYTFGGAGTEFQSSVYDPTTQTATLLTGMPFGRLGHEAALVGSLIYLIGGYSVDSVGVWSYTSAVDIYNPATGTWISRTTSITPRENFIARNINGRIYLFGGYNGQYVTKAEVFEP